MRKLIVGLLFVVLCVPSICYGASYNTVTIAESTYSYYEDGSPPEYNKHAIFTSSTGNPVYCGNHGFPTSVGDNVGDSKSLEMQEYNNDTVSKILYYGYLGPKEWSGFSDAKYNGVYKAGSAEQKRKWCGNAVTGIALTKTQGKGYFYEISGFKAFWEYISNAPMPPDGFKTYVMYGNSSQQDLFTWSYNPQGILSIKKEVANYNSLIKQCPNLYSLGGAEYLVSTDREGKNSVGTFITKEDGTSNTLTLKAGTYYVRETVAPKGFKIDKNVYTVDVSESKTNTLTVKDEPLYNTMDLLLLKTDSKSGNGLEGAVFRVNYYNDFLDDVSNRAPNKTWLFKTDKEGRISLSDEYKIGGDALNKDDTGKPLGLLGTYEFTEIEAPAGYAKDTKSYVKQVKENKISGNATIYTPLEVSNTLQTISIVLQKYNEEDKYSIYDLSGAIYEVKNEQNEIVGEIVTNKEGKGKITKLSPGTYTLKEIKAPEGFMINDGEIVINAEPKDDFSKSFEYVVEAGDKPTTIEIFKYEELDGQKVPLSGATLQLINGDGEVIDEFITTDREYVIKYLPVGKYVLREINTPEGYVKSDDISFEITDNQEIVKVEMKNELEVIEPIVPPADTPKAPPKAPVTGDYNDLNFWYKILLVISFGALISNISSPKKY